MENEIITCAECGIVMDVDGHEPYQRADGEYICDSCREKYYVYCSECDELVHEDDVTEVDGEWVCEDCLDSDNFFFCDDCQEYHRSYDRWGSRQYFNVAGRNRTICESCLREDYYVCEDCGDAVHYDDVVEICGDYYCPYCAEKHQTAIHRYGYKPDPIFKNIHDVFFNRIEEDNMYFGVELEIDDGENREVCAGDLINASEDIYCKEDGSLDEEGIEIVTHPCTLAYHTEALGWNKLCEIAKAWGYKSQYAGTCGLHVHVGKKALGSNSDEIQEVEAKIVMIFCRHWDELVKFSRRKEGQLADWARKPMFEYGEDKRRTINNAVSTAFASRARYQAVNLTNYSTVEFRLFNGTLKSSTIIATLQLVSNICHYAKEKTFEEVMASQWTDIAEYVKYDELQEYLYTRELSSKYITWTKGPMRYARPYIEQFSVGDRVKLRDLPYEERWMNSLTARVAAIDEEGSLGISFDCGDLDGMNDLDGRLESNCGLWIAARCAVLIEKGETNECA